MSANYITLAEARKLLPGRPSIASLWRWARRGCQGRNGERIHLRHYRAGRKLYTTPEDLDAFVEALAAADQVHFAQGAAEPLPLLPPAQAPARTPEERERAAAAAVARIKSRKPPVPPAA